MKGATEDEMVGWPYRSNGHELKLWEIVEDTEAWYATVYKVTKSWTQLSH